MRIGLGGWLTERIDRLLASDPGLGRLRMAFYAVVSMGTSLGVTRAFIALVGGDATDALVGMLLGAVVAMMGSMALNGQTRRVQAATAANFPIAMGIGMAAGVAVGDRTDLMLAVFVLIMFGAVFVRRFGRAFFFYGFMTWMGYFFASFLHATPATLPRLVEDVAVASVWVLLLAVTVLRDNPARNLRRTLRAYDARARSVARAIAEVLQTEAAEPRRRRRWQRRVLARQAGVAEAGLIAEGWSEDVHALPPGWSAQALRRRLIDVQQVVDRLASGGVGLVGAEPGLVGGAVAVLAGLARRDDEGARASAERLVVLAQQGMAAEAPGWVPARLLAMAAIEFLDLAKQWQEPPDVGEADAFAPAAQLAMGNLPGAPAAVGDVAARGARWNVLARLDMSSRQAIQVAIAGGLAILFGRQLSETRYYWAVIAAFVAFTGTATRSETFIKAFNRVLGTLAGLVASLWLANLTSGHGGWVLAVILASMFCGFYLLRVSYAYMIFFVTIMIGQLYSTLHELSDALLVLRLEETAIGAAVGIAVAMLVTPLSTHDAVRSARAGYVQALSELVSAAAEHLDTLGARPDLDASSRALDEQARQLNLLARPLTRPLLAMASASLARHRLGLFATAAAHARALAVAIRAVVETRPLEAQAGRALASAAQQLAGMERTERVEAMLEPLAAATEALVQAALTAPRGKAADPVVQALVHLHDALADLGNLPDAKAAPTPPHARRLAGEAAPG